MALFEAKMSVRADRVLVTLSGECDLSVREELTATLVSAVARSPLVVVDLGALGFLDSSGVHALISAYHAARARDGHLYVANAGGVVADVLELTGVGGLLARPADDTERSPD